jgi:hypothetical protein
MVVLLKRHSGTCLETRNSVGSKGSGVEIGSVVVESRGVVVGRSVVSGDIVDKLVVVLRFSFSISLVNGMMSIVDERLMSVDHRLSLVSVDQRLSLVSVDQGLSLVSVDQGLSLLSVDNLFLFVDSRSGLNCRFVSVDNRSLLNLLVGVNLLFLSVKQRLCVVDSLLFFGLSFDFLSVDSRSLNVLVMSVDNRCYILVMSVGNRSHNFLMVSVDNRSGNFLMMSVDKGSLMMSVDKRSLVDVSMSLGMDFLSEFDLRGVLRCHSSVGVSYETILSLGLSNHRQDKERSENNEFHVAD